MFICQKCKSKCSSIKIKDGIMVCDNCFITSLSGHFDRKMSADHNEFEMDILQPYNKDGTKSKDYIDAYGEGYYTRDLSRKR